jgi:hypothetical protein
MKSYMILKSCIAGGQRRQAGDVVDLPDSEGNALISMRRCELTSAAPAKSAKSDRSVGLAGSEAATPRKRKAKGNGSTSGE